MELYHHEYSKIYNVHLASPVEEVKRFLISLYSLRLEKSRTSLTKIVGFGRK